MTRNISHLHRQILRGFVILAAGLTLSGTPAAQTPAPSWPIAAAPGELRAVVSRADLIVVSMGAARQTPMYDPISHLVYTTRGDDVRTTIVNGKILMRDRKMLTLDERAVLADAGKRATAVRQAVGK